ncbi:MAG TPA: FG-GAP repeat protein [Candidatus Bathyarchaeia archaeon]|nr:FG-GAP repeat protein [Candidatus Bathyarchaeia archaeon]
MDRVAFFGRVYVFDVSTGSLVRTFNDPNATDSGFGRSIALFGKVLVVGAPFDKISASTSGRLYVFGAESGKLKNTLVSPEAGIFGSFGCFGNAVDSTMGRIIVGDPCQAVNGQPWVGAVYIFSGVVDHGRDDSGSNVNKQ